MDERLPARYAALGLVGVGLLVVLLSLPVSSGACNGVESLDPSGAYQLLWIDTGALQIHYSPDGGLSRCYVGVGAFTLPVGIGAAGLGTSVAGVGFADAWTTRLRRGRR
jgi:hypothetical protein